MDKQLITLLFLSPNKNITTPKAFKSLVFGVDQKLDINTNTIFLNLYEQYKQLLKYPRNSMSWFNGNIVILQQGFIAIWTPQQHEEWKSFTPHCDALRQGMISPARILEPAAPTVPLPQASTASLILKAGTSRGSSDNPFDSKGVSNTNSPKALAVTAATFIPRNLPQPRPRVADTLEKLAGKLAGELDDDPFYRRNSFPKPSSVAFKRSRWAHLWEQS